MKSSSWKTGLTVLLAAGLLWAVGVLAEIETDADHDEVEIKTEDGILVYGDLFVVERGKKAPTVLLFHQAGSNGRAEYGYHVGRLTEYGYNVFLIDQRSGGSQFGGENRTVEDLSGDQYSYCDAYPDLEAALEYLNDERFTGPRYAWGSSYSATLALRLGMEYPDDLSAVLAFSPAAGQVMAPCSASVYIKNIEIPSFVATPASEVSKYSGSKKRSNRKMAAAVANYVDELYVADNGVHGASMLDPNRVGGDVDKHWKAVMSFMKSNL